MYLTRHSTPDGPRWAADGRWLPPAFRLADLLGGPAATLAGDLERAAGAEAAAGALLPPVEPDQEVWAAGVTYLRSREAREAESATADVYTRVYAAERPELFFKAPGGRVVGPGGAVRIRSDSTWDVPEPELALVVTRAGEIAGYCAGNDMSSRSIEGANPLYLPQAKIYDGACALGPGIVLAGVDALRDLTIGMTIRRAGQAVYAGETRTSQMKRTPEELVAYLTRELAFPTGVFLLTGTGLVPPEGFTLQPGDAVEIRVGTLVLANAVQR